MTSTTSSAVHALPGLSVFPSALWRTNAAVVETPDLVLVCDPTWLPSEIEALAAYVRAVRAGRPLYLLFTHSDYDHIWGWGAFPDAITVAGRAFVDNPDPEKAVGAARAWDDSYYVTRPYPITYPTVDIVAERDGQTLIVGGTRLTFYAAPGHTPDGLWTVLDPPGVLLAGDYLSDVEFPFLDASTAHSDRVYEATLAKMDALLVRHAVRALLPGHGAVALGAAEILARGQRDLEYLTALRRHSERNDQAALDAMPDAYPFPLGLKPFHEANQRVARGEPPR